MSHPPAAVERGPPSHLTDHFDLPRSVQLRVASSDDAVALLRAFLEAGGRTVRVEEPPIRAGDEAVAVVPASFGRPVTHRELNAAFRTFEAIGAARGLVITPGSSPTGEARRRELFAPTLRHVGPGAIQRMADAVTLGADPLEFAVGVPCQSAG